MHEKLRKIVFIVGIIVIIILTPINIFIVLILGYFNISDAPSGPPDPYLKAFAVYAFLALLFILVMRKPIKDPPSRNDRFRIPFMYASLAILSFFVMLFAILAVIFLIV